MGAGVGVAVHKIRIVIRIIRTPDGNGPKAAEGLPRRKGGRSRLLLSVKFKYGLAHCARPLEYVTEMTT